MAKINNKLIKYHVMHIFILFLCRIEIEKCIYLLSIASLKCHEHRANNIQQAGNTSAQLMELLFPAFILIY